MPRFLLTCPAAVLLLLAAVAVAAPPPSLIPPTRSLQPQPPPAPQAQPSQAQPSQGQPASTQPMQLSRADQAFLTSASQNGMVDAQAGQLGIMRGTSGRVKQLGKALMSDQNGIDDALQQIATQDGLTLPDQPSMMQQAQTHRLNVLYGADFDRAFVNAVVAHDSREIALYQQEARSGHDAALKQFAQQTLPVLRRHLALAASLNSETTANGNMWHGQD